MRICRIVELQTRLARFGKSEGSGQTVAPLRKGSATCPSFKEVEYQVFPPAFSGSCRQHMAS